MIKLVISEVPQSYNTIAHKHWTEKDRYNSLWRWAIKEAWLNQWVGAGLPFPEKPFEKAKIDFYIYFPNKHRRDKMNYAVGLKGAIDQLITEKIIVDDNWERIEDQYYQRYDPKNPRTEIIIEEIK